MDLTCLPEQRVIYFSSPDLHISCLSSPHHSFLFDVPSYFFHIVSYLIVSFDLILLHLICLDLPEYFLVLWSKTVHFSISYSFHGQLKNNCEFLHSTWNCLPSLFIGLTLNFLKKFEETHRKGTDTTLERIVKNVLPISI